MYECYHLNEYLTRGGDARSLCYWKASWGKWLMHETGYCLRMIDVVLVLGNLSVECSGRRSSIH